MPEFKPKVWVRTNCPYSFKFRLFLAEAGISDHFDIIPMDPDSPQFAVAVNEMTAQFETKVIFPIVEISPGKVLTDSDVLIEHFASEFKIDQSNLPTLSFYRTGLFVCYVEMFAILARPLGWIARFGSKPKAFR